MNVVPKSILSPTRDRNEPIISYNSCVNGASQFGISGWNFLTILFKVSRIGVPKPVPAQELKRHHDSPGFQFSV